MFIYIYISSTKKDEINNMFYVGLCRNIEKEIKDFQSIGSYILYYFLYYNTNDIFTDIKYALKDYYKDGLYNIEYEELKEKIMKIIEVKESDTCFYIGQYKKMDVIYDREHFLNLSNSIIQDLDLFFKSHKKIFYRDNILRNLIELENQIKIIREALHTFPIEETTYTASIINFINTNVIERNMDCDVIKQKELFELYSKTNHILISFTEFNKIIKENFKFNEISKDNVPYWKNITYV